LNGKGSAIVAEASSNYKPFRQAAQTKTWSASAAERDGMKILVLDNLHGTRIIVGLADGKGLAYILPEGSSEEEQGVSDILCQILVKPE